MKIWGEKTKKKKQRKGNKTERQVNEAPHIKKNIKGKEQNKRDEGKIFPKTTTTAFSCRFIHNCIKCSVPNAHVCLYLVELHPWLSCLIIGGTQVLWLTALSDSRSVWARWLDNAATSLQTGICITACWRSWTHQICSSLWWQGGPINATRMLSPWGSPWSLWLSRPQGVTWHQPSCQHSSGLTCCTSFLYLSYMHRTHVMEMSQVDHIRRRA